MLLKGHCLPRPAKLIPARTIIDIGAGIRPIDWYQARRHICVEPHPPYADRLRAAGYEVFGATALHFLRDVDLTGAAVYLLDVIEHMERDEGELLLDLITAQEPAQVVVFTPNGFMPQEGDAWGLGGEHWQKHRSGWTSADFPDWDIELYGNAFYAIWTRRS